VISALLFGARLGWLRAAWASGLTTPLISQETATELFAVLAKPKFRLSPSEQEETLADYLPFAEMVVIPSPLPALAVPCRDEDDEKFLHLAITAKADLLVTGDDDLLVLRGSAPVRIITLAELREITG